MNVFDKLSPTLQLILAQCSSFGLDLAALASGGAQGLSKRFSDIATEFKAAGIDLKAVLNGDFASLKKPADIGAAVEEATKQLQASLESEQAKVLAATQSLAPYSTAFAAVGITVKASDEKAGVTAADIEQAIRARASILAQERLAKTGLNAPLALTPAADPAKPVAATIDPKLTGLARVTAALRAESAARKAATAI